MTIEIKISAFSPDDFARKISLLNDRINGDKPVPTDSIGTMSLQDLIDMVTERAKAAGFNIVVAPPDIVDEAAVVIPDKKARRKKAAVPEKEEADNTTEIEYDDLDHLKKEVIDRCSQLLLDGQREVVMDLKKKFGRTLSDLPSDRFPEIKQEMERLINGSSDE